MSVKRLSYHEAVYGRPRNSIKVKSNQLFSRLFNRVAGAAILIAATTFAPAIQQTGDSPFKAPPAKEDIASNDVLSKSDRLPLYGSVIAPKSSNRLTVAGDANFAVYTAPAQPAALSVKTVTVTAPPALKPKTPDGRIVHSKRGPVEIPGAWANYIRTPGQEEIFAATHYAADNVGVSDIFLQLVVKNESGHQSISADKGTAEGPCQFIKDTWLMALKKWGAKHGYQEFADTIKVKNGDYVVADPALKEIVLKLRRNERASALMAGEYARENYALIKEKFPKLNITETHLYEAHFFGGGDIVKFLNGLRDSPNEVAAGHFPRPARSNPNIFYNRRTGQAYTYAQIHAHFRAKMSDNFRLDVPALLSEPQPDPNAPVVTLADLKTDEPVKITHRQNRRNVPLARQDQTQTHTVSLFSVFKNNATTQPLPKRYTGHHKKQSGPQVVMPPAI